MDDKDIFGSTYSIFSMKHETSLFAVALDISTDCKLSADQLKREANIDEDKGMLQIRRSCVFLFFQMKRCSLLFFYICLGRKNVSLLNLAVMVALKKTFSKQ